GAYERACDDYTRALELAPNNAAYLNNRGFAHYALGAVDAALADYDAAIALDAGVAPFFNNRALALRARALGAAGAAGAPLPVAMPHADVVAALADHERALSLDPRSSRTRLSRALTRVVAGEPHESVLADLRLACMPTADADSTAAAANSSSTAASSRLRL